MLIIGATNHSNLLDEAFRRPGRFDRELNVKPPDATQRYDLLHALMAPLIKQPQPQPQQASALRAIAEECVGFVAADMAALVRHATMDTILSSSAALMTAAATDESPLSLDVLCAALRACIPLVGASALRNRWVSLCQPSPIRSIIRALGDQRVAAVE
jgi:SpoVK/Ycf46/Vps4 family AAA+-type ATPase